MSNNRHIISKKQNKNRIEMENEVMDDNLRMNEFQFPIGLTYVRDPKTCVCLILICFFS